MAVTVSIPSFSGSKPTLYEVSVDRGSGAPYVVKRRYNEFLQLAQDVEAEMGEPVAVAPPAKPSIWQTVDCEQRRIDLEIMLKALVRVPEFAESLAVGNFLELYSRKHVEKPATQSLGWVHTTTEISRLISDARMASQTLQMRQKTVQAKALIGQMQRQLSQNQEIGTGERRRRQQQLDNYLVTVNQLESSVGSRSSGVPSSGDVDGSSRTRVLGETEETRKHNNSGLLQSQQSVMLEQDEAIEDLRVAIGRQKELGLAIHDEIQKQNDLLDDLDTDVHRLNARLNEARRKTDKLNR